MGTGKQRTGKLHRDRDSRRLSNGRYKNNNGGYSLIELVIVLAIIAIIMSTVFYSIILIFSANAKSCANNIQRAIGDCKVTTMGKSAAYMKLYRNADGDVFTQMWIRDSSGTYVNSEPQKVGTRKVTLAYKPKGDTRKEFLAGDSIEIWFDRSTGGFEKDGCGNLYEIIYVEGGSKKYEIELTELTGKSEVKAK